MATAMIVPQVHGFEQLIALAKERTSSSRPKAAMAVPFAPEWLLAFDRAVKEKLVEPVVVGDEALFRKMTAESGIGFENAEVIDINQPDVAFVTAAQMAARGEVDLIIKGHGSTVDFLKLLLREEALFKVKGRLISHIAVMKPERYPKLLFLTDAGVVPLPDLKTKLALVNNITGFAAAAGVNSPRIALLAAVEAIYPQMPVTTEAAVLAKMSDRGQIKGAYVDGPLSFDVAVDTVAAHSKGITNSEVAGQADAMVAPNIETANGVYRAMALYGRAEVGGLLFGGRVPVALANRWDSVASRFHAIVLAVLAATS